jgi:hypothetical protein
MFLLVFFPFFLPLTVPVPFQNTQLQWICSLTVSTVFVLLTLTRSRGASFSSQCCHHLFECFVKENVYTALSSRI